MEGKRLWKKKDRLPSLSGRGDRAHQENTKEASLKEGERERRERCERYSIQQDGPMMRKAFSPSSGHKGYLRGEDFGHLHMEPYNQKEAAKISVDISGGKGKDKVRILLKKASHNGRTLSCALVMS